MDNSKRLEWYYGVATQILQQADKFVEEADVDRVGKACLYPTLGRVLSRVRLPGQIGQGMEVSEGGAMPMLTPCSRERKGNSYELCNSRGWHSAS